MKVSPDAKSPLPSFLPPHHNPLSEYFLFQPPSKQTTTAKTSASYVQGGPIKTVPINVN